MVHATTGIFNFQKLGQERWVGQPPPQKKSLRKKLSGARVNQYALLLGQILLVMKFRQYAEQ